MSWIQSVKTTVREWFGGYPSMDPFGDDTGEQPFSRGGGKRDLSPISQMTMLARCRALYDSHPLAAWLIDQRVSLLLNDELGFSVEVDGEALGLSPEQASDLEELIKRTLNRFWDGPRFSIRYRADELVTSLFVDGELVIPIASLNEIDGLPQIDMTDASRIDSVESNGGLHASAVFLKRGGGLEPERKTVIAFDPETQRLQGEVFFFRYSHLANQHRGRSKLIRQADWLDLLDQFMFARADKAALMNMFQWDIELKGAGETEIRKKAQELRLRPVRPGSQRIHNENEKWTAITPDLKSDDATAETKLFRDFILGSHSTPATWFSDGGDTTRTTAGEQNDIALMALRRDRKMVRSLFRQFLYYAYDQMSAKQPALFLSRLNGAIKIEPDLPPLDEKDISRLGGVIQNVEAALEAGIVQGLVSRKTARKVFLHVVDRLGVPVDPDDEERTIAGEKDTDELTQAARAQALAAARIGGDEEDVPEPNTMQGPGR